MISISDGLGPSVFCQKMERTRPMREAMDGRFVYFPPQSAFRLCCFNYVSTFPYLYLDLACKQLCFTANKKVEIGEMKVQKKQKCYYYFRVLMI